MPTMTSMLSMHEDVKERTNQNDQPREPAEEVRPMLGYEIKPSNR
jgi:hypothetical protein